MPKIEPGVVPKIESGSSDSEAMTETEEEKAKDLWKAGHADMVNLFMKRTSIEQVQSTFDLLKPETQDYLRFYEASIRGYEPIFCRYHFENYTCILSC